MFFRVNTVTAQKQRLSVDTAVHCISFVLAVLFLILFWSCIVFCVSFLLFDVIRDPVLTDGTKSRLTSSCSTSLKLCIQSFVFNSGRWREVLNSTSVGHLVQMKALVTKYPEVAEVRKYINRETETEN